jgi:hypothetical protein
MTTSGQQHQIDKFNRDALATADGWCEADGCLHRIECYDNGRPLKSPFCPLHQSEKKTSARK